jgi:multidrug efflux pump subunit AcrA (membrane-fusion protein)
MNKKDIALTVGGVLATMVVAYLIYKMQQRDAAATAAAAQSNSDAAAVAAEQSQEADASANYQYSALLSSVGTGVNLTGSTTNTTAAVASSGATADTGATGTTIDSSDIDNLMSQIISTFAGSINSQGNTAETVASMTIPTIAGVSASDLTGIPTSAAAALANANENVSSLTILPSTSSFLGAMQSNPTVSSHPVTAHPIVSQGT